LNKHDPILTEEQILKSLSQFPIELLKIYPRSFAFSNGLHYGLIRTADGRRLVVLGEKEKLLKDPFRGDLFSGAPDLKLCGLTPENTQCLMDLFPHTRPVPLREFPMTFGAGDRLGTATPGHLRAIRKYEVRPVLAQQSVRENKQTVRTFADVVNDVVWSVFQENYRDGYGADGDHLKSIRELEDALRAGVSMVTLDLSEKLDLQSFQGSGEEVNRRFAEMIDQGDARVIFHLFLDREFLFKGSQGQFSIRFDEETVKRNTLLFHRALDFTEEVFQYVSSWTGHRPLIDFEISIDETTFPTSPESHLFFVIQLQHRGVRIDALAPRFVGEFQKGIDYIGDHEEFRKQFDRHAAISRDYGKYKISIHSGSDKFSVFPIMGELAKGALHVKTAGTSWLEAMRLIAMVAPSIYREMHQFSLSVFNEAAKLYHVTTDLTRIPDLKTLRDADLADLLDQTDSRQLLHITYGYLLNAKGPGGKDLFRSRFARILDQYEEDYWDLLVRHFEKHLDSLGVPKRNG
jgi:tagaturonate epimerase